MKTVDFYNNPLVNLDQEAWARIDKAKQARENAQLSTGPTSPEGKAISARNAIKHGFAAAYPVIEIEDKEAYDDHLASYRDRFQPIDQVESDTVRRAAIAMWKHDRIISVESILFDLEYQYHEPLCDAHLTDSDPIHKLAIAFKSSNADGGFDLCRRYLASASRDFDRAIRTFYLLKSKRENPLAASSEPSAPASTPKLELVKPAQNLENTREPNEPTKKPVSPAAMPVNTEKSPNTPLSKNLQSTPKAKNVPNIA